jgi:hypothetical protein
MPRTKKNVWSLIGAIALFLIAIWLFFIGTGIRERQQDRSRYRETATATVEEILKGEEKGQFVHWVRYRADHRSQLAKVIPAAGLKSVKKEEKIDIRYDPLKPKLVMLAEEWQPSWGLVPVILSWFFSIVLLVAAVFWGRWAIIHLRDPY